MELNEMIGIQKKKNQIKLRERKANKRSDGSMELLLLALMTDRHTNHPTNPTEEHEGSEGSYTSKKVSYE